MERICAGGVQLKAEEHVGGLGRAAYCLWVMLPDGRRVIENVITHHENGLITHQVDVEAWDPES